MDKYLEILKKSSMFAGMTDEEILSVLSCLGTIIRHIPKDSYALFAGDTTNDMGIVLSGSILIVQEDLWGRRNIMSRCEPGDFFAEPYAATPGTVMNVSAQASEDSNVMMLNVGRLLTTCSSTCIHHQKLIRNLVSVLADKVLRFNAKVTHISKRSTREKLLSYLSSQAQKNGCLSFDIPFDRQQLADYLCVERAAMSAEISKLQKEGIITTNRSHFELHKQQ